MATRFYLMDNGKRVPDISPAVDAGWSKSTGFTRVELSGYPPNASSFSNASTSIAGADVPVLQLISDPLPAQTIAGTVKGQIFCQESANADDMRSQIVIRVVSKDGATVRGTLLSKSTSALSSEWPVTPQANRKIPLAALSPAGLTPVSLSNGDRIVVELGFRAHGATANTGAIFVTEGGVRIFTDLPEDETTTDVLSFSTWIEFSQTLRQTVSYRSSFNRRNPSSLSSAGTWAGSGAPSTSGDSDFFGLWPDRPYAVYGFSFRPESIPTVDTTVEFLYEVTKTDPRDRFNWINTVVAQIPGSLRSDTGVGYYLGQSQYWFPEPIVFAAYEIVQTQLYASLALTLGDLDIFYRDIGPSLVIPSRPQRNSLVRR